MIWQTNSQNPASRNLLDSVQNIINKQWRHLLIMACELRARNENGTRLILQKVLYLLQSLYVCDACHRSYHVN